MFFTSVTLFGQQEFKPKASVEIADSIQIHSDSIIIVSCAEFALRPFGPIPNQKSLRKSPLSIFSVKIFKKKQENGVFTFHHLTFGSSYLYLFFDDSPESSPGGEYLFSGVLRDSTIQFVNGIKVGMKLDSFIKTLFDQFNNKYQKQTIYIVIDYCVNSLRQIYYFDNGILKTISFVQPGTFWKVP